MTTPTESISTPQPAEGEFQAGQVMTVAGGHFLHDTFSAFLSPLLPLLIEKLSLSLTLAGSLSAFMQFPSLLQPLLGYLDDKINLRYLLIFAPAVTATAMSCMGFMPNYASLVILLLVAGLSSAAYHATSPPMIARFSGDRIGRGMSLQMAAGELGRTLGPLLVVWGVSTWGFEGVYRLMVIGWATSLILFLRLRKNGSVQAGKKSGLRAALPAFRRLFLPLWGVIFFRSFQTAALSTFLPTFMSQEGASLWMAGASLSIMEFAGVIGALVSGTLSDRLGRKPVLMFVFGGASIMMLAFLNVGGWLIVPVLLGLGFTALSATPVLLAMVQDHLPEHRSTANGFFMAMSFLTRMVVVLLIGVVGDNLGLRTAFVGSAFLTLLAIPVVLLLPKIEQERR